MSPSSDLAAVGPPPLGLVLAGGASRRMGQDKALLPWEGIALVEHAARRLAEVVDEVAVADAGRGYLPGRPSLPDGPGHGPVAGLLGAAERYPGRSLLALACDLPAVPAALLRHLARPAGFAWVVPRGPRGLEPLVALYAPSALAALARRVARGQLELWSLAEEDGLEVRVLEPAELAALGFPASVFRNLNRPEDLARG